MRQGIELVEEDIIPLQPKEAVKFFRDLIWAVAPNAGVQADSHVNLNIYTPDGGIDAEVENDFALEITDADSAGLIPEGRTGYQIKTSKPSKSDCGNELLNSNGEIKSYIEEVASSGGNYVFVTFSQLTPEERDERIEKMEVVLEEAGYEDCDVDLFASGRLVKFANKFPSLVFKYSYVNSIGRNIEKWGNHRPINTPREYTKIENREEIIEEIRFLLQTSEINSKKDSGCPIIRIVGTSGVGKTRLVYEAVNHEQFANRVVYEEADNFENSELAATLEIDSEREAILVLDNCSRNQHRTFKDRYETYDRLALITVSTDHSEVPADRVFEIRRLETDEIKEILNTEFPNLSGYTIDSIGRISDGYPEMALVLAEKYKNSETDHSIVDVPDATVFDRLLAGDEPEAPELRDIKRVLTSFAFFSRVRWSTGNTNREINEREWVIQTFNLDADYSKNEISEIVQYAKRRGVLRGDEQLSLGTIPLATYLMEEELERNDRILDSIGQNCPPRLQQNFAERIPYINTHQAGQEWAAKVLIRTEWFKQSWSGGLGPIFRALAEIAPGYALEVLENAIGQMDQEQLEKVKERRTTLESLRRIAVWEKHFFGAAELLRKLAEAENDDRYMNNSTGIFADLFSPHYGPYAPTEVAPIERYPILEDLHTSGESSKHRVGLDAAERVLSIKGMVGGGIPQRQGAKPSPDFWVPENNEERIDYFKMVWELIADNLDRFDVDNFEKGVDILLSNSRKLAKSDVLSPIIRSTFDELLNHPDVDESEVMEATARIVYYDSDEYPEAMQEAWEEFEHKITNRSFHSRLKRYVGGHDLIDRSDERESETEEVLATLADEAVEQPNLIEQEADWLFESSSRTAVDFGRELGKRDQDNELIDYFVDGLYYMNENGTPAVFGGYLETSFDSIDDAPDGFFDRLRSDDYLANFFPFLTRRASVSDAAALLIFESVKQGHTPHRTLMEIKPIARSGKLSNEEFLKIIKYLSDKDTAVTAGLIVNLSCNFYQRSNSPPIEEGLVIDALTHPALLKPSSQVTIEGHWYEWEQLTEMTIDQDIDNGFEIANSFVKTLQNENHITATNENIETVFRPLFENQPRRAWKVITTVLESDNKSIRIESWLAGEGWNKEEAAILLVSPSSLLDWVEEDPESRAQELVRCIPSMKHNGWWELTREVLVKYGDQDDVFGNLSALETGGGWTNDLFKSRYDHLKELRQQESNLIVRRWLSREMRQLERFIG